MRIAATVLVALVWCSAAMAQQQPIQRRQPSMQPQPTRQPVAERPSLRATLPLRWRGLEPGGQLSDYELYAAQAGNLLTGRGLTARPLANEPSVIDHLIATFGDCTSTRLRLPVYQSIAQNCVSMSVSLVPMTASAAALGPSAGDFRAARVTISLIFAAQIRVSCRRDTFRMGCRRRLSSCPSHQRGS